MHWVVLSILSTCLFCVTKASMPCATTCQLHSGASGCCPHENGVCCSNGFHCCPMGTQCNLTSMQCHSQTLKVFSLLARLDNTPHVDCGLLVNSTTKRQLCPAATSCCGQFCCPYSQSECCAGGQHCCPKGMKCGPNKTCRSVLSSMASAMLLPSFVLTPLGSRRGLMAAACSSAGHTVCKMENGQHSCCPLANAVCCKDKLHCCPSGAKCNTTTGYCERGLSKFNSPSLLTQLKKRSSSIVCPDGTSVCSAGTTCCGEAGGRYSCCSHEGAVCCEDGVHCCPHGFKCDLTKSSCESRDLNRILQHIPLTKKTISKKLQNPDSSQCADGQSYCPEDTSCCKLSNGEYGCCPLPQAVCCADGVHCCPNGYTCDVSKGMCNKQTMKQLNSIPMFRKTSAKKVADVQCPDGQSSCPSGNTCCKLSNGEYGCCPLPQAMCCDDGVHCCPNGYTCDVSQGTCNKQSGKQLRSFPIFSKTNKLDGNIANKISGALPEYSFSDDKL